MVKSSSSNGAGHTRPRRLLLCLDGVPLEVIRTVRERGLFDNFAPPSRLLSPFPTMTNIALAAMMGASAPLGYESLYFDRKARETRGGVRKYIGRRTPDKVPSTYMDELDYQEPLAFEFLVYVAPEKVWRADMRRFRERFRAAPRERDYFAFLKGTDGLLHIRGPERLAVALESLDRILREIQDFCGQETEIVLFSDHGMNLEENRRVPLQTHLKSRGFETRSELRAATAHELAIPAFGLCGYAALYCRDSEAMPLLAESLVDLKGVDFSIFRDSPSSVMVKGEPGSARIDRKENNGSALYRYFETSGDPLKLGSIRERLRTEGKLDKEGFAEDRAWLDHTASHDYPDALANLYTSLHTKRVAHTADVLVSFRDGYYYGWSPFARFVRLAATHGNALRPSTSAFMMSTHRVLPEYIRADDARPWLRT
ncbi:MAG TPA: alkaline phosphatase family protein [Pyrinomonadaceae bacterium]|nr:alkaline phosphatase family protein [Pyrinomonadaceae bacterium]